MAEELDKLVIAIEGRITDLEKKLARAQSEMRRSTENMQRTAREAAEKMNRDLANIKFDASGLAAQFGALKASVAGLAAFGGFAVIRKAFEDIKDLAELGDVADRLGVTAEALQELQFAATQSGASVQDLRGGLQKFAKEIGEAASKGGDFARLLTTNGVALRDQAGNIRPLLDLLGDFSELIRKAGSEAERFEIVSAGMGKGAGPLVSLLAEGRAGLDKFATAAREAGVVVDNELVKRAQDLEDEYSRVAASFERAWKSAVVSVAGFMRDAMAKTAADVRDLFETAASRPLSTQLSDVENEIALLQGRIAEAQKSRDQVAIANAQPVLQRLEAERDRLREMARELGRLAALRGATGDPERPAANVPMPKERPTFIPSGKEPGADTAARVAATKATHDQADATERLIKDLEFEVAQHGRTALQQEIETNLRRAGADATTVQGQRIAELTTRLHEQEEATKRLKELESQLGSAFDQIAGAVQSAASGTQSWTDALRQLSIQLATAAAKALFMQAVMRLIGAAGGFGGGAPAPVSPAALQGLQPGQMFAEGGRPPVGKVSVVGEKGRELFVPDTAGTILPHGATEAMLKRLKMPKFEMPDFGGIMRQWNAVAETISRAAQRAQASLPQALALPDTRALAAVGPGPGKNGVPQVNFSVTNNGVPAEFGEPKVSMNGNGLNIDIVVNKIGEAIGRGKLDNVLGPRFGLRRKFNRG